MSHVAEYTGQAGMAAAALQHSASSFPEALTRDAVQARSAFESPNSKAGAHVAHSSQHEVMPASSTDSLVSGQSSWQFHNRQAPPVVPALRRGGGLESAATTMSPWPSSSSLSTASRCEASGADAGHAAKSNTLLHVNLYPSHGEVRAAARHPPPSPLIQVQADGRVQGSAETGGHVSDDGDSRRVHAVDDHEAGTGDRASGHANGNSHEQQATAAECGGAEREQGVVGGLRRPRQDARQDDDVTGNCQHKRSPTITRRRSVSPKNVRLPQTGQMGA